MAEERHEHDYGSTDDNSAPNQNNETSTNLVSIENLNPEQIGQCECSKGACGEDATRKLTYAGGHELFACADDTHVEKLQAIEKEIDAARKKNAA